MRSVCSCARENVALEQRGMRIVFRDQRLAAIRTEQAARTGLSIALINACRRKLLVIEAAPDERTLRNWRSLHYEKLHGDREGQYSVRLNDQWRLVFVLDESTTPTTVTILEVVDYH